MPTTEDRGHDLDDARVMDVAMDVGDLLLGMGMPAADVISHTSDVCRAQASRRVHVDMTSTMLTLSQDGGAGVAPLTMMRPVPARSLDYGVIQQVSDAVADLVSGRRDLDELERITHRLMARRRYSGVQLAVAAGLISAGCGFLFGAPGPVILATFLVGCLGERMLALFSRLGLPVLVAQAGAAAVIVAAAKACYLVGGRLGVLLEPGPIVVGGIVMLVVGMKFVAAFQDALDGYYVTASAGIFRVVMLTTGIVIGILFGLWVLQHVGIGLVLRTAPLGLGPPGWQVLGAALIAGAYAWYCHANRAGLLLSTVVGAVTWAFFLWVWGSAVGEVPASGLMGILSGLLASLSARRWRIPALAITTAGIVTGVPGLRLYMGLMQAVSAPLWSEGFFAGLTTLTLAAGVALAIAVGASLGVAVGRPLKQRLRLLRAATARRFSGREKPGSSLALRRD